MKQLKDYLYLYPKSHLIAWDDDRRAFDVGGWYIDSSGQLVCDHYIMNYEDVKVSLRPLSDMTDEERKECRKQYGKDKPRWISNASQTAYLLSIHVDLFGLIEAGLANDKTALK